MLEHRKIAKQFIVGITIFTMFLLVSACNRTSTTTVGKQSAVVTEVSLSGVAAGSSIEVGTSRTLSATVKGTGIDSDSNGVNWTVSGGATIVPAGNSVTVTGTSAGDAVVTATSTEDSSKANSVTLKIVAKPVSTPAPATTGGLDISVSPAGAKVVVKSKADGKVISDATGGSLIENLATGTYSIASSLSGYDSATIEVNVVAGQSKTVAINLSKVVATTPVGPVVVAPPVVVNRVIAVTSDPSSVALEPGKSVTVVATVYGEGSFSDSIRFSSADPTVATVDEETGKITAVAKGIAVIKAISKGTPNIFGTTQVTVTDAPATTGSLELNVTPVAAKVVVKDSSGTVVSDATGYKLINDLTPGTYTIEASLDGYNSFTRQVNVLVGQTRVVDVILTEIPQPTVSGISLVPSSANLETGESVSLFAEALGTGAFDKTIKFTSQNPAIATVDDTGKVTAVAKGTVVIVAESAANSAVKAVAQITVTEPVVIPAAPAPAPVLSFRDGDELVGSQRNWSVTVSENDNELKNLTVYLQPASANCTGTAFDVSKATTIMNRVFNAQSLTTQAITIRGTPFNTAELADGTDGGLPTNNSTAQPLYKNGSYIVRAVSTSHSDTTAYDQTCVNFSNPDQLLDLQFSGNSAKNGTATWYGNDDVTLIAPVRRFGTSGGPDVVCTSSSAVLKNATTMTKVAATATALESYTNVFEKANAVNKVFESSSFISCNFDDFSDYSSDTLLLDNVAPTSAFINADKDGAGTDFSSAFINSGSWYGAAATFTLSGADGGVGISTSKSRIDAITNNSAITTAPIKTGVSSGADILESPASSYLVLKPSVVQDELGNQAAATVGTNTNAFSIDKTAPIINSLLVRNVLKAGQPVNLNGFVHSLPAIGSHTGLTTAPLGYQSNVSGLGATTAPFLKATWTVSVDGVDCKVPAGYGLALNPTGAALAVAACKSGLNIKESNQITVTLVVSDAACNESVAASASYIYDVTKPTVTVASNNATSANPGAIVPITVTAKDNLSAKFVQLRAISGGSTIILDSKDFSGANASEDTTFNVPAYPGFTYHVVSVDGYGNVGPLQQLPFTVNPVTLSDNTAPSITAVDMDPNLVGAGQAAQIIITAADSGGAANVTPSGINNIMVYKVGNGGTLTAVGTATLSNGKYTLALDTSVAGVMTYQAIATDNNGNISAPSVAVTLTVQ